MKGAVISAANRSSTAGGLAKKKNFAGKGESSVAGEDRSWLVVGSSTACILGNYTPRARHF
jgi:hypothetical protein